MRNLASKRYARALLQIGIERGNTKLLQTQLAELATIFVQSPEFRMVIANPSISIDERRQVIRQIAQKANWDAMMVNLALLLVDKDRIQNVAEISEEFQLLVDVHEGNVRATVTSARTLGLGQIEQIKQALAQVTGKKVIVTTAVDASLLGGVVTRVGDTVYDGSVKTQLNRIRESILAEV